MFTTNAGTKEGAAEGTGAEPELAAWLAAWLAMLLLVVLLAMWAEVAWGCCCCCAPAAACALTPGAAASAAMAMALLAVEVEVEEEEEAAVRAWQSCASILACAARMESARTASMARASISAERKKLPLPSPLLPRPPPAEVGESEKEAEKEAEAEEEEVDEAAMVLAWRRRKALQSSSVTSVIADALPSVKESRTREGKVGAGAEEGVSAGGGEHRDRLVPEWARAAGTSSVVVVARSMAMGRGETMGSRKKEVANGIQKLDDRKSRSQEGGLVPR